MAKKAEEVEQVIYRPTPKALMNEKGKVSKVELLSIDRSMEAWIYARVSKETVFMIRFDDHIEFVTTLDVLMNFEALWGRIKAVIESSQISPYKLRLENISRESFARLFLFYEYMKKAGTETETVALAMNWEVRCYGEKERLIRSWYLIVEDFKCAVDLKAMDMVYYCSGLIRYLTKRFTKCHALFGYSQVAC